MRFVEDELEQNVTSAYSDVGAAHYSWEEAESCALPSLVCVGYGKDGLEAVDFQSHFLAVGQSGSGKTESFVQPTAMLLAFSKTPTNVVIGDSKGGVAKNTGPLFESRGYRVFHVNLRDASPDAFNPLLAVYHAFKAGDKSLAEERLAAIIRPLKALVHSDRDVFWEQAFEKLLSATVMAMMEAYPQEEPTLSDAADLIGDGIEGLERLASRIAGTAAAARLREALSCKVADKTTASLVIVSQVALDFWSTNAGRELTGRGGVDIEDALFSETPTCLFVTYPDESVQGKILASILFDQIYNVYVHGYEVRTEQGVSTGRGVRVCYDEWGMLPRTDMPRLLATSRSRGLFVAVSCQSVSQMLISGYSEAEATTMLSQFGTLLLFRNCDESIAKVAYARTGGAVGFSDLSTLSPGRAIVIRNGAPAISSQLPSFQWLYGESPLRNVYRQAASELTPRPQRHEPAIEPIEPRINPEPCELRVESLDDLFCDADDGLSDHEDTFEHLEGKLRELTAMNAQTGDKDAQERCEELVAMLEDGIYSDEFVDSARQFAIDVCEGTYGRNFALAKFYEQCAELSMVHSLKGDLEVAANGACALLEAMLREVERFASLTDKNTAPESFGDAFVLGESMATILHTLGVCAMEHGAWEDVRRIRDKSQSLTEQARTQMDALCEGIELLYMSECGGGSVLEWFASTGIDGVYYNALKAYQSFAPILGIKNEFFEAGLESLDSIELMANLHTKFDEMFGPLDDDDEDAENDDGPKDAADVHKSFLSETFEPMAAERAYYLVTEAEEHVGDGEFAVAIEMIEEALRLNPELKATNHTQFIWGMACYGAGKLGDAADHLIAFAQSELATLHRDRDDAACAMNEIGFRFIGIDQKLAKKLFKCSRRIAESLWERSRAANGLATIYATNNPRKAAKTAREALGDNEWQLFEQHIKDMRTIRKRLKRLSEDPGSAC